MPRCFDGQCVAILAGGRTLKPEDVDHLHGRCRVIAINRAFKLAPWADWLYACDAHKFWEWHPEAVDFPGTKIVVRPCGDVTSMPAKWRQLALLAEAGVEILRHSGLDYPCPPKHTGLSPDPGVVRGNNSLFQVLSVIHHTGAATVILLGADMKGGHWHGGYQGWGEPNYQASVIPNFDSLVKPLEKAGIAVLNASPGSLLPWRPIDLRSIMP